MKSPVLTLTFAVLSLLSGFAIGLLFKKQRTDALLQQSVQEPRSNTRSVARAQPHFSHFLSETITELRASSSFPEEVTQLQKELKSPLRASSTLGYYAHETSYERLSEMLAQGKIRDLDLLEEIGSRLVKEDPDRVLSQFMIDRKFRFGNIRGGQVFHKAVTKTAAWEAPEQGFYWLSKMERGGNQRAYSLGFSSQLAQANPQMAVDRFEELVHLRGIGLDETVQKARTKYAKSLMKKWAKTNREAAENYLTELPEGPTQATLVKALESLSE